ncbi:MAG: hypothetical protein IJM59_13325 [Proteobacteria bacterium]|nr:hypothetical protein [Pseudomonadota bacterium]
MKKFALASVLIVLGCGLVSCDDSKDSSPDCGQYTNTKAAFGNIIKATASCEALQTAEHAFNDAAKTENFTDSDVDKALCMGEWLAELPASDEKAALDAWNAFDASCSSQVLETLKPLMPGLNPGSSNNNNNNNNTNNNNCEQLAKTKAALSYAVNLDGTNCDTLKTAADGIANAALEEKAIASAADTKGLNDLLTTCAESWGVTQAQRAAFDNHLSACNTNTDPQKDKCDEIPNTKSAFEKVIAMDGSDCEAFKAAQNSFAEAAVADGMMTSAEDASGLESVKKCGEKWGMDSTAMARYAEVSDSCSSSEPGVCDNAAVKTAFNDIFSQKECNNMMSSLDSFNQAVNDNSFTNDDKTTCVNQWIDDVIVWDSFRTLKTCENNDALLQMISGRCDLATESKAAYGEVFTDHEDCSKLGEAIGNYFTASDENFKKDMGIVCADLWLTNDMLHAFVKLLSSEKFKECESQFIDYLKDLGRLPSLAFEKASDSAEKDDEKSFKLTYLNADTTPVDGAFIQLSSSDDTCIMVDASAKTGNDGAAEGRYKVKKDNCTAKITAKTPLASATMTITVGQAEMTEYDTQISLSLDSKRYDSVGYVAYMLTTDACENMDDAKIVSYLGANYNKFDDSTEEITTSKKPELVTFDAKDVDVKMKSVLVYAKNKSTDKDILALGCKDISAADAGKVVKVDMEAIPSNIEGKYDLVSNFDLVNSGFEKTPCNAAKTYKNSGICVPAIEDMKPGDWVTFITDLYREPLMTILEYAWSNIYLRVVDIMDSDLPPAIKSRLSDKDFNLGTVEPYLEPLLGKNGEWYNILSILAADGDDLTLNMQLAGKIEVLEADDITVNKAKADYSELQYQWSYKANEAKNCIANAYGKSKCRKSINLTKNDLDMSGEWNGSITLSDYAEDKLRINDVENFKWASMLYVATFGTMLSEGLDYKVNKDQYMKAFLTRVLYEPVVKAYNADPKNANSKVTVTNGKECEAFVEASVRLLTADMGLPGGLFQAMGTGVCNKKEIGEPDTLLIGDKYCNMKCADIADQKVKEACEDCEAKTGDEKIACLAAYKKEHCGVLYFFQSLAENPMTLSSKQCLLYDEGTVNYTSIGKPDEPVKMAGEIFAPESKETTNRCVWDNQLAIDGMSVSPRGIFHAVRQE